MKTIRCNKHPGGPAMLPETDFYPSDRNKPSGMCKTCNAAYYKARDAAKRAERLAPKLPAPIQPAAPIIELPVAELSTTRPVRKIGGYFIHEQALLVADTLQAGKIVLFTTILEVDGETKHPRNKRIIFSQQASPDEYRATLAWLAELSAIPPPAADTERDAALQLAEEAERKLQAVQKENGELRAALDAIRAAMNGRLVH